MAPFKGFTGNSNKRKETSKPFKGYTGGTKKFKKREETRSQYFDNRKDITNDRLDRRQAQADEYQAFKNDPTKTKLVEGSTNLFQAATSGGKTLAQKEQELALKYGPTFSEIASDVSYAGGKVIGALGEKAMSGSLGIFGIVKEVANYAADKASGAYNSLTNVQKEIADNPNRYTFAAQQEKVRQLKNFRDLQSQAERDALGLRLDALQEASAQDATGIPAIGGGSLSSFVNEPIGTFGTAGPTAPVRDIEIERLTTPVAQTERFPAEEIKEASIDRFSPEYLEQQKKLLDELNLSPQVEELLDDKASITPYDNPFNLEFVGQEGAEPGYGGETGERFASFDSLDRGLKAGISRVSDIVGDGITTEEFLDIYSPKSDNPKSYDNYLAFLEGKVGSNIDPNEIRDLSEGVIRFENTSDVADQYLNYLQKENNRMYEGIVS